MRIGNEVVRIKEEFNLCKVGDIRIIDGLKIYNKSVKIHLTGDHPDTWHSQFNFRLTKDVDMPCLLEQLRLVEKEVRRNSAEYKEMVEARIAKRMATVKAKKSGITMAQYIGKDWFPEEEFD